MLMDAILNTLSEAIRDGGIYAPLLALVAGVITSITPCAMSQLPLVLGYVGKEASPGKAFRLSLVYAVGSAVTFTAFGIAMAAMNRKRGYLGALAAGILGGVFSSPCSTPVLVVLLSIAAADGEAIRGGFLLLLYAVGCTALAVILGSSPAAIRKLGTKPAFRAVSNALNIILGILVLLIGLYMLYLGF